MNRLQWQRLAERWLLDARAMLASRRWSAAYYVAGYAVECGLKACVLAHLSTSPEVIFDDRRFSERCWTHSAFEVVRLAGLETARAAEMGPDLVLSKNWEIVKDWKEDSRYKNTPHYQAKKLYNAIIDNKKGVMRWIRAHW